VSQGQGLNLDWLEDVLTFSVWQSLEHDCSKRRILA